MASANVTTRKGIHYIALNGPLEDEDETMEAFNLLQAWQRDGFVLYFKNAHKDGGTRYPDPDTRQHMVAIPWHHIIKVTFPA